MTTIHQELLEAISLLGNTTATPGEDADRIGLAELAIRRVLDSIGDPSERPYHIMCDDTGLPIARTTDADPADIEDMLARPVEEDGRSEFKWLRLRDGTLALVTFPLSDTYMEFSDRGVCDFWGEAS